MKITIENLNDRLRLRWMCPVSGKRKTLAVGMADSPAGRAYARSIKDRIETDAHPRNLHEYYDPTLLKYRDKVIGKNSSEVTMVELFDRFTKHQQKNKALALSSVKYRYVPVKRMLEKHLNLPAANVNRKQVEKFALICADTLASGTAKERIWLLKSAWEWGASQYQLPQNNPWAGIVDRFKPSPKQPIKPFTINELQAILSTFANHRDYKHYSDFVSFMANTGCRFGEAVGLRWKHLGAGHKTVWIGESVSRGVRRSTKTGKARTVHLSPTLQAILAARFEKLQPNIDDLIFPAPRGGAIDDQNFRPRAWKQILAECSIEYRRPYALRHSAISHALANGANPIALAEQTGHDKRVLLETYAHAITKEYLFVEI
jgi:integrase